MTKTGLRQKMKEQRNNLPTAEQHRAAEEILQRLTGLDLWLSCVELFTYLSFGSEVDTRRLVKEALSGCWGNPKAVYVPRVEGRNMNFYQITEASTLKESNFGVPEPEGRELIPYGEARKEPVISEEGVGASALQSPRRLMLLPGLAFDLKGNRLGYGAGYYDRFLTKYGGDHFIKVALAYDFQIQERVPAEEHDIRMDYIITPGEFLTCRS